MSDEDEPGFFDEDEDEVDERAELKRKEASFLMACERRFPQPLADLFRHFDSISKLGEGIIGEVFEGTLKSRRRTSNLVIKVVPIQGDIELNGERQKRFEEMEPEIKITRVLSDLANFKNGSYFCSGFAKLFKSYLAYGEYPARLLTAWETWNKENESWNKSPKALNPSQKYLVLQFQNGGKDADDYDYHDARQAFSVIMQVVHSLAVAEAALEFEHRDLHIHNVLVQETSEETITYRFKKKNGAKEIEIQVPSYGVSAVMIDFGWSRIKDPTEEEPIVNEMSNDPEMFVSQGKYQYDIYRKMKDANRDNWKAYLPKTNIFWIHYLCDYMLVGDIDFTHTNTKEHEFYRTLISKMKNRVRTFSSCQGFVTSQFSADLLTSEV